MDTIDWESHRQAIQRSSSHRVHYTKLCHELLPTGLILCRYGMGLPDYCLLCKLPDVDFHHVLLCPHEARMKWRTNRLDCLFQRCRAMRTDPFLIRILRGGIEWWLLDWPFDEDDIPRQYLQLLSEQATIRWNQFFQGRVSCQWNKLQKEHVFDLPTEDAPEHQIWTTTILRYSFEHWKALLEQRNNESHSHDASTAVLIKREQAHQDLATMYTLRDKVLHWDRHIFFSSLYDHQSNPLEWSTTVAQHLSTVITAKCERLQNVRSLHHYFPPGDVAAPPP